ncbi:hypothetical protein [Curtobacterium sp. GD1]|uniref:hypothetical protein n=1 Tax=Curtobacterium sp. GD1 TaxID=2810612 RepID=UPI001E4A47E9|nr:hypothetical protein [Curtobacterium sp. GD1]MCC8908126.1 hypothetical protein [Curtobacterium sp. GD1]
MHDNPQQYFLLTATVRPNMLKKLRVTDPTIRLRQYQDALKHWVEAARQQDAGVIIVETSGFERSTFLSEVAPDDRAAIQYVNYEPSAEVVDRGIGYIEWSAIRYAIDSNEFDGADTVYKVTGRLVVTNPGQVFGKLASDGVRLRTRIDGSHSDTRVLGASVRMWQEVILPAAEDVDYERRIEIEHCVAARIRFARTIRKVKVSRFPRRPLFAGQSGTNGSVYSPWKVALQGLLVRPLEPLVALAARSISH